VEAVFEGQAHAEVGGQAERGDHLGGPNPSGDRRCFLGHAATVTRRSVRNRNC
jgi:hypothetical protein